MSKETETVEVTLKMPKQINDFYIAFTQSENKILENLVVEELITSIKCWLDLEPKMKNLIIYQYGLEKILGVKTR